MSRGFCTTTLLLSLSVVFVGSGSAVELRRGPYLQVQRPDGVSIRWRTDPLVRATSIVRYGTSPDTLDRALAATEVEQHFLGVRDWQATIDGLEPDTVYYYALEADRVTLCGADDKYFFRTSPRPGTPRKIRFWTMGDFGANRPRSDALPAVLAAGGPMDAVLVRNGFRKFNRGLPLDGFILLGDNAYPTGTDEQYQGALFGLYADELRSSILWPSTGNHDIDLAYEYLFTVNSHGKAGGTASKSRFYYSADIGNVHLIVLDPWRCWWVTTTEADYQPWRRQLEWLEKDLAATRQEWIIIANHFPVHCDGNYNSDNGGELAQLRQALVPLLDRYRVDLFLAGHDHTYQRSYLISGLTGSSAAYDPAKHRKADGDGRSAPLTKRPAPDSGTMYIVCGTGGGVRPDGKFAHPAMIPFETPQGRRNGLTVPSSLVFEVEGLELRGWQVDVHGGVVDNFTIRHQCSKEAKP